MAASALRPHRVGSPCNCLRWLPRGASLGGAAAISSNALHLQGLSEQPEDTRERGDATSAIPLHEPTASGLIRAR